MVNLLFDRKKEAGQAAKVGIEIKDDGEVNLHLEGSARAIIAATCELAERAFLEMEGKTSMPVAVAAEVLFAVVVGKIKKKAKEKSGKHDALVKDMKIVAEALASDIE